ncbi:GIN domain-containing protein [Bacteroidota bacterium]
MKTIKLTFVAIIVASITLASCSDSFDRVTGDGPIVTRTLQLDPFSSIEMQGIDDVYITYGTEQSVRVEGHENIIARIKTAVVNGTWYIELENENYGHYELTYYLQMPAIENIASSGTGDVIISESMQLEDVSISLVGTGSFLGFPLSADNCNVDISGSGDCEITVNNSLDVIIDGTGSVYYKGSPQVNADITGTGKVNSAND